MKNYFIYLAVIFTQLVAYTKAQQTSLDSSKASFYSAYEALKKMLDGTDSLNYEKAVFITENAYYNNQFNYNDFKHLIDINEKIIRSIADNAKHQYADKYKTMKLYEQNMFNLNASNWAIYTYLTDTTIINNLFFTYYNFPINYSKEDPYGSLEWENTQVINLLTNSITTGNCYALSSLFKIYSDRLKSEARLTIAPHHIYIQNRNQKGDYKNIELATKTFPGDGTIQTLTYTTHELIMNGMSQRPLSNKEAVALTLIYLAKGFEHKFNDNTNEFLLKCADLAFKNDSLSLNSLLLKAEVTENRLFAAMSKNKIKTPSQARANLQTQKLFVSYEKQLTKLYKLGYREIPKDIEHILLSAIQNNNDGYITTDKTPNPFAPLNKNQRYATLSWGLFDEMHEFVDTIQYSHVLLNTKTKKIIEFFPTDTTNNYKVDPVVFAMSVDPLARKFPSESPYLFCGDNPIYFVDKKGQYKVPSGEEASYNQNYPTLVKYLAENVKQDVMNSSNIMAGLLKYSGGNLTDDKVLKATSWKSGPTIMIKDNPGNMQGANGFYNPKTGTIEISTDLAKQLENASDDDKQAALFGLFVTLTHETVHYGDYLDGLRQDSDDPSGFGGEPGVAFVKDVFNSKTVVSDGNSYSVPQLYENDKIKDAKEMIEMNKDEGKSDVIPTVPTK